MKSVGEFRDVVISVMGTVAELEREKISERTKAGLERAKKQGEKLGSMLWKYLSYQIIKINCSLAKFEFIFVFL